MTWSYVQSGNNWVAEQSVVNYSNSQLSDTRTLQFANLNWSDNASKDAARAAAGSTVQAPPTAGPFPSSFSWTPPASLTPSPNNTTIIPSNCNTNAYSMGGSQNIVFQHGLNSSSCAWAQMQSWLSSDYLFGTELVPSLEATQGIATQGQELISDIQSEGGGKYILMGHSMGGVVSRYAAQYFQSSNPSLVFGVATVDTPHQGANVAWDMPLIGSALLEAKAIQLWFDDGCGTQWDNPGCFFAYALAGGGGWAASYYANTPALQDLTPGSAALNSLNANPESFTRAAVIGYTPQRWLFSRVAWNWFLGVACSSTTAAYCCPPQSACGEDALATDVEIFYDTIAAEALFVIFEIETYCEYNNGDGDCEVPPDLIDELYSLLKIDIDLDIIDAAFNILVDFPGDGTSDGLVQGPSQYYPGTGAVQYPLYNAASHSGALKSYKDHPVLDAVLANSFNMRPSASCTFSVPTTQSSPDVFAASGGSDSFQVTASSSCPWSAVPQGSWISITSGLNGVGGGSVSFSVAADSTAASRAGTIQVGNGNNSTTFFISQIGSCGYTLSEGPILAIPSSGASGTVQVSTQQNCAWSASSNAAWLTLVNASGTGGGSFSWTAAANTGTTGRTGTITVANQTITFIDGNPAGTPGTATVTISGSPQSYTFNPCAPHGTCTQTMPESGTVSITVDGIAFTMGYDGATASQIASNLAIIMNYQYSPVTATVNGATITINASVNGSDTNYSLAVSETYNPQCGTYAGNYFCFSGPAFSPVPSGSALTGGTD
jgi:pimeloyl-ACP methyl ester carboxylesterase